MGPRSDHRPAVTDLELARDLGIAVDDRGQLEGTALMLQRNGDRLEVSSSTPRFGKGLAVEFSEIDIRTGRGGLSRKQPLARAFGARCHSILDATAGLGHDAFLLACLGYQVTAVERSKVLAALIEDGLRRAQQDERLRQALGGRLQLAQGDSRELLPRLAAGSESDRPDAVYLDPMYPAKRKKSALPPKSIRLVRELVGDDPDAGELFAAAQPVARRRVVVKRPLHAKPLAPDPDLTFRGKLARFDVYLTRG